MTERRGSTRVVRTMTILALTLAGIAPATIATGAAADPLASHRWTSRLLVVIAPGPADASLATQRRILAAAQAGLRERDLVVLEGIGQRGDAPALRARFEVPPGAFRAILVGKDGGAKLASDRPISAEALFGEIDAMPMRRQEIRTKGS